MLRKLLSFVALCLATLVFFLRVREVNEPPAIVGLAPRSIHLLYLDSLRAQLLTFAEQYGKPVFMTDTIAPATGHGRIQFARLREALLSDPDIVYGYTDNGFSMEWRGDARIRMPRFDHPPTFEEYSRALHALNRPAIGGAWPQHAAQYARLRREWITPQWPDPPVRRRPNQRPATGVPPHADAYSINALGQTP